jgi:hypothetical protein
MKFESAAVNAGKEVAALTRESELPESRDYWWRTRSGKHAGDGDTIPAGCDSCHLSKTSSKRLWSRTRGLRIAAVSSASLLSPRNKYLATVGTMVLERKYEANIAKTTASASGTKRYRATPDNRNIGANTMQIER